MENFRWLKLNTFKVESRDGIGCFMVYRSVCKGGLKSVVGLASPIPLARRLPTESCINRPDNIQQYPSSTYQSCT